MFQIIFDVLTTTLFIEKFVTVVSLQFFLQAKRICPSDPLVYNELGVVAYHMRE